MTSKLTDMTALLKKVYAPRKCPVCDEELVLETFPEHCREKGDDAHIVAEVLLT